MAYTEDCTNCSSEVILPLHKAFSCFFLLLCLFLFPLHGFSEKTPVYVVPIKGVIDLGLSSFVKRALSEADGSGAKAIVFELETFGGRLDAALEIRDTIFAIPIKTVAFVNKRAISAGALISVACQHIVMAPGATMGAATPVAMVPGTTQAQPVDEKMISFVRKEFKATAERNGHPTILAEAMVDPDVEIKGVVEKGKLLTVTTEEALELKLAEYKAENLSDLLSYYGLDDSSIVGVTPNWSENLVRFLTHPLITGLLLTIGLLGILFELRTPGWGVSGTLGLICLALFFGAQYMVGLSRWVEPILFFTGLVLLGVEIFIIPGFGITGVIGLICMISSLFLALVKHPLPKTPLEIRYITQAVYLVAGSFLVTFLVAIMGFPLLNKIPFLNRLVLTVGEEKEKGFVSQARDLQNMQGKEGVTLTVLRPSGKAMFGNEVFDVVSEGEFISEGRKVKIIKVEGNRIIVSSETGEV